MRQRVDCDTVRLDTTFRKELIRQFLQKYVVSSCSAQLRRGLIIVVTSALLASDGVSECKTS